MSFIGLAPPREDLQTRETTEKIYKENPRNGKVELLGKTKMLEDVVSPEGNGELQHPLYMESDGRTCP